VSAYKYLYVLRLNGRYIPFLLEKINPMKAGLVSGNTQQPRGDKYNHLQKVKI
jgi:hypothetical protein